MGNRVPIDTVASLLCLTERRVRQLSQSGIIPPPYNGMYDMVGSVRGYITFLQQARPGGTELLDQRLRLMRTKADVAELRRDKLRSELVPVAEVAACWRLVRSAVKARFASVPKSVAIKIGMARSPAERQALIRSEIDAALADLSKCAVIVDPPRPAH